MAKIDLTSREWCELVFEGKNKAYGAYEMRQTSPSRHNKALVIVVIFILIAFSLPFLLKAVSDRQDKEVMEEVTTLANLETPEEEPEQQELKKPDLPPPPPLKSTIKFTPPVIKKDEEVREEDEMKTQEDLNLNKTAISIADIKGTDDIHGKDIADIREVVKEPVEEKKQEIYHTVEQMPQFPASCTGVSIGSSGFPVQLPCGSVSACPGHQVSPLRRAWLRFFIPRLLPCRIL